MEMHLGTGSIPAWADYLVGFFRGFPQMQGKCQKPKGVRRKRDIRPDHIYALRDIGLQRASGARQPYLKRGRRSTSKQSIMPDSCCANGCTNRRVKGGNIQFFTFPFKDQERLKKWIAAVRRRNFLPTRHSRICSEHFTKEDYLVRPNINVPRLNSSAVPSIFHAHPKKVTRKTRNRRKKLCDTTSENVFTTPQRKLDFGQIESSIKREISGISESSQDHRLEENENNYEEDPLSSKDDENKIKHETESSQILDLDLNSGETMETDSITVKCEALEEVGVIIKEENESLDSYPSDDVQMPFPVVKYENVEEYQYADIVDINNIKQEYPYSDIVDISNIKKEATEGQDQVLNGVPTFWEMTERIEQRYCIKFCQKLGDSQSQTIRKIQQVFGEDAMGVTQIKEWFNRFKDGRTSAESEQRCGRPQTARSAAVVERVRNLVMADRRLTVREIAEEVGDLLDTANTDPGFLNTVITGDESWVYGYDPGTKRQSSQWKHPESPRPKKARQVRSKIKVMLTVFFDVRGIVHHEYAPEGQMVTKEYYHDVLWRLRDAVRRKRPDMWTANNWHLQHDNAPAHSSQLIHTFLAKHGITTVHQPPYSPDLAPCDFWLFPKLKTPLKGSHFESREEIMRNATTELNTIPKEDFQRCFRQWKDRWAKCVHAQGAYFEGD
ncbi:hypothetical protein ANN_00231 [Periplaneta americana]|uniref:THAP-type domain-containing protein n=1 Tax=Periplaneta americana TaxID=6978 RepID=A0ABQ8TQ96_PERAM|nr:hypothetical protein ANN_00231 [Periplaneta americana]